MSADGHQKKVPPPRAEMVGLALESILDNSITDFDLYVDINGLLTLYAPAPYRWYKDELGRLLSSGHKHLYYHSSDRTKVEVAARLNAIPKVDPNLPPDKRMASLTDAAAELTRILYDYPISPVSLAKGQEVAKSMVDCVLEDLTCVRALGKLASHDSYTYYHSARVAAYALAIALHLSARDKSTLEQIAIGCLLHDIGKSKIDLKVINKAGALTDTEWGMMRMHPAFGDELVRESNLSIVPREIIIHHHERMNGQGYPHGLKSREVLDEVKIAAFSDIFDALTTNRPYQVSRSRFEALEFIKFRLMDGIFLDAFRAMVEILKMDQQDKKTISIPNPTDKKTG